MKQLPTDDFLRGYLTAAMWTECPDPASGDFKDYALDWFQRLPGSFVTESESDCRDFTEANQTDLDGLDMEQAGTDFWLSRNGHGAGFWDRGLGQVGDRLHQAAKVYGSAHFDWEGWFRLSYRCKCGERWTRPECSGTADFGEDTCDACGSVILCDYREGCGNMEPIEEPAE